MAKTKFSKRPTKNRWTILLIVAIVIGLGGMGYYFYKISASQNSNVKSVETATIGTGDIILTATGIGTLLPGEEVSFGFKNSGQVSKVLVSLGDQVEAGQVLARLDSKFIELKYKQAEANLAASSSPSKIAAATQALQEAKENLATARNNLQYLIGPDMLIAEEQVATAQQDLQVAEAVLKQDASDANKQKVSEAESNLTKARETLTYAYYNYSNTYTLQTFTYPIRNDKGVTIRRDLVAPTDAELIAARAAYELAKAKLNDAQNYLDVLMGTKKMNEVPASSVTSITEAKIALAKAKADLDAMELVAPIRGTVTSINLNVGEDVGTSEVITIANLDQPYTVEAHLDETDWDKAKVGSAANVTFDLLPDKNYSGTITQVYPKLDDSPGISMVRIFVVLNVDTVVDLPAGASASVDVLGGEALDAILVPISALQEVGNGKYIVHIIKNDQPVEQEVEIGLQDILYAEVKSGLRTGDVVVTDLTINE